MRFPARLASRLVRGFALAAAAASAFSAASPTSPASAAPASAARAASSPGAKFLRSSKAIAGQYIVVLKGSGSSTLAEAAIASADLAIHAQIDRLAARHSAAVLRRYTSALLGFSAKMSEADALALAEDPTVAFVEENGAVHATAVLQGSPTWGLDRVDQPSLPLDTRFLQLGQGEGATIYVVDTGIRATHAELAGRVLTGVTAVDDGNLTNDCNGHGTHVAGTAAGTTYGIAKKAKLVPVRVLDCAGNGSDAGVVAGIDFITGKRTPQSVVNMSLAGDPSPAVDQAVAAAVLAGVVIVAAAGNDNLDACGFSPSRAPAAITVGSTNRLDARSDFSNFGACVDLSAPGTDITSSWFMSDTDTNTISGTSMATPHVAGAVAAYRAANKTATPAQVATALTAKAHANKISDPKGSPNLLLNTRFVDATAPIVTMDSPRAGKTVRSSFTLELSIEEDNLDSIAIAFDGAPLATSVNGPFKFVFDGQADGDHAVVVVATDLNGQRSTTDLTITVGDDEGGCSTSRGPGAGPGAGALLFALAALLRQRRQRRR